jgi:imidazoleglycerol-phosphate dehydratase
MSIDEIPERTATVERATGETEIQLTLSIDGDGACVFATGVPFLDHMLDALARHSGFAFAGACTGDVEMDPHHTVEDVGIVFGQALKAAIGTRAGIARYGFAYAPLDEALARVVVDFSGRPYLHFEAMMPEPSIGASFASSLVEEFWRAAAVNAGLTMHIDLLRARNAHHAAESIFKAAALALRQASRFRGDSTAIPSTKGVLG